MKFGLILEQQFIPYERRKANEKYTNSSQSFWIFNQVLGIPSLEKLPRESRLIPSLKELLDLDLDADCNSDSLLNPDSFSQALNLTSSKLFMALIATSLAISSASARVTKYFA